MGIPKEAREVLSKLNLDTTQIHKGMTYLTEYDITVLLETVYPIITKQAQKEATAYYAEMMKKAINKVREKAYKQAREDERKRIIAWGLEACPHWSGKETREIGVIKRDCSLCWQALQQGKDPSQKEITPLKAREKALGRLVDSQEGGNHAIS